MISKNIFEKFSSRQSAEHLADLGGKLFSKAQSGQIVLNHAGYIRDSSAKTLHHYSAFLFHQSFFMFWLRSAVLGMALVLKDSLSAFGQNFAKLKGDTSPCDVLIISHLTNEKQLGNQRDPYFADLATQCQSQGGKVITFKINHIRASIKTHDLQQGRLIENGRFGLIEGFLVWLGNVFQSASLILRSVRETDQDFKRYLRFLACTQMDHRTMASARIVNRIAKAADRMHPKVVILTYEGYSWERAVTHRLRQLNPTIKILGYQHAVLSGGPRAINKKFYNDLDPDHILAAGSVMADRLVREGEYSASDYTVIGSPKAQQTVVMGAGNALAAFPEGTLSETVKLAECLCHIAHKMPEIKCILRMHPVLSWEKVKPHIRGWDDRLPNLHVSDQSLDEDINQAGWVLYRGSSVVINALQAGRRAIFLDVDNTAETGDIVSEEITWRKVCQSASDVMAVIQSDQENGWVAEADARKAAEEYARQYYTPLNTKMFEKVINEHLN